jgi:hypothetical protein
VTKNPILVYIVFSASSHLSCQYIFSFTNFKSDFGCRCGLGFVDVPFPKYSVHGLGSMTLRL